MLTETSTLTRLSLWEPTDDYVESWEAPLLEGLLRRAPILAISFFRSALTPVVRVWLRDLVGEATNTVRLMALFYRFGLVTGRIESWPTVAKRLAVSKTYAMDAAAYGLVDLWRHCDLVAPDAKVGELYHVAVEVVSRLIPPEHPPEGIATLSDWTMLDPASAKAQVSCFSLWNEEHAQHPERIEPAKLSTVLPWKYLPEDDDLLR